ncbi:hypothetical protein V8C42DRAFT_361030 [Trichoderma barbatum]
MPFLGTSAERNVNESSTEASEAALSATQSTQSIPAFPGGSERRSSHPAMRNRALFKPDLRPIVVREPISSTLLEESPLGAMSLRQSSRKRVKRRQWEEHQNLNNGETATASTVKDLKEVSPDISRVQAVTDPLQEKSVTTKPSAGSRHPRRRLTEEEIRQDMLELKEGVAKLDKQRLEQPCHLLNQMKSEHEQTSSILCEIKDKAKDIKEPAYIPTITITGCSRQTSPYASPQEELADLDHLLPPIMTRLAESNCGMLAVRSSRRNSDSLHTNPSMSSKQNPISSVVDKLVGEPRAGITCLEREVHEMQPGEGRWQDNRTGKAAMLAPENSLLRKSTFTRVQTLQLANQQKKSSEAGQELQQLMAEKEPSLVDHQTQMLSLLEKHQVCPEYEDEDDTENLLSKYRKLDKDKPLEPKLEETDDAEWDDQEEQEEPAQLRQFLRFLKAWAQLYWSTVWPILDPRTLRVEHEGPMPLWKACLLIVLAAPAVALGLVVAIQGTKFVFFMAWLLNYVDDGSAIWV